MASSRLSDETFARRMFYKITFVKLDVSADEWLRCFHTILEVSSSFTIHILSGGKKVGFIIESSKKLDVLNSRLTPLYLSDDLTDQEEKELSSLRSGFGNMPNVIKHPLFEYLELNNLKFRNIYRLSFTINKYNPLWLFPMISIDFEKNGDHKHATGFSPLHINSFLAFDLTQSISAEVEKVKPVLATSSAAFQLFPTGILKGKSNQKGSFSIRSYDFCRHSLILGQSGSGKSYLLKLMIEDIQRYNTSDYCVVLIDPHAGLESLLRVDSKRARIDFKQTATNLFVNIGQPALSTELTIDLFSTVINVHENQNLERVLKFALIALYNNNTMTVVNLKDLLTDSVKRKDLLSTLSDRSILQFFDTEYQQLYTGQYATAVLPIINILSELQFIDNAPTTVDLVKTLNDNFLVSVPIKQTELGSNITHIIGGALIQQIFTIMQAGLVKKKVILMIDEVSIVQTPSLTHILSESRKFNLTLILAQQYLMQVTAPILQSIFANMVNYFCFKLSRDDAEIVARNLNFEIDEFFLTNKNDQREILELGIRILTELNPREVIARVLAKDQYYPPFKSKTTGGTV